MGKKRRQSNDEPSELPCKQAALDLSVSSHAQDSSFNRDSDDSSDTSSSSSSHHHHKKKKEKKRKHKERRQADKYKKKHKKKKRKKHHSKKEKEAAGPLPSVTKDVAPVQNNQKLTPATSAVVPARQIRAPMTKAEWEKQQSIVRRVHDPSTGRDRLVKGDGEILEEIVTKDRHKQINKKATLSDGLFYESQAQFFS